MDRINAVTVLRWMLAAVFWTCLMACTPHESWKEYPVAGVQASPFEDGPTVQRHLQSRYAERVTGCTGGSGNVFPAFLCSGILMRATGTSVGYYPWNPKPGSGGVSFSWLRGDANFMGSWHVNGFIVLPQFYADNFNYEHLYIDCAFAVDGWTWYRSQGGCGPTTAYPVISDACHTRNISTAAAFWATYQPYAWNQQAICGFSMKKDRPEARQTFMEVVALMKNFNSFTIWNELVVHEWAQNLHRTLPIEAFYYVANPVRCQEVPCPAWTVGRDGARKDQKDFRALSGRWVPVIRMTMPASVTVSANFEYRVEDQGVLN